MKPEIKITSEQAIKLNLDLICLDPNVKFSLYNITELIIKDIATEKYILTDTRSIKHSHFKDDIHDMIMEHPTINFKSKFNNEYWEYTIEAPKDDAENIDETSTKSCLDNLFKKVCNTKLPKLDTTQIDDFVKTLREDMVVNDHLDKLKNFINHKLK